MDHAFINAYSDHPHQRGTGGAVVHQHEVPKPHADFSTAAPHGAPVAQRSHAAAASGVTTSGATLLFGPQLIVQTWDDLGSHDHAVEAASAAAPLPHAAEHARIEHEVDEPPAPQHANPPQHARPKFAAAWEVDRFDWPQHIKDLCESESDYFRHAGKKLLDASREGLRVLAVLATRPGEGCTTFAMCLARAAARAGAKVALLDGDLYNPQLGSVMGLDFACSWHDAMDGNTPLGEAAVRSIEDGVTLIALARTSASRLRDYSAMAGVVDEAARGFDLVVTDLGEQVVAANGESWSADAAIIVRDVRHTPEEMTLTLARRLKARGIEAVGVAENFVGQTAAKSAA